MSGILIHLIDSLPADITDAGSEARSVILRRLSLRASVAVWAALSALDGARSPG